MKTKKRKYQRYTPEQKGQAVGLMKMGTPVRQICLETGISLATLQSWKKEAKKAPNYQPQGPFDYGPIEDNSNIFKKPYDVDLKSKIKEMVRDEVMRVLNEIL